MVPLGARTVGLQIVPPLPSTGMSECQLDPDQDPDLDSFTVECTWTEAGAFSVYLTVDGIPLAEPAEVTVGPGPVSAGNTGVLVDPGQDLIAGDAFEVIFAFADAYGNPVANRSTSPTPEVR